MKRAVRTAPEGTEVAVATRPSTEITMDIFNSIRDQASQLIKTGFLPVHIKTPEQAVAIVLMGRELGIPMMQALRGIYVVQGTPALASQMMLALANRTGELEDFKIEDNGTACTVTVKRKGRQVHVETFSMTDAEKMGLTSKDNWRKQPKVMRRWRAVSAALRVIFPDAIAGTYTLEERDPDTLVDADGFKVVEAPAATAPAALQPAEELQPRPMPEQPVTTIVTTQKPAQPAQPAQAPGPAETKGEQSSQEEAAVKERLGQLFSLLSGPAKLEKAARIKWMTDNGFPTSVKMMTVDILDKAIAKAKAQFVDVKAAPAAEPNKADTAKQDALHKVFGLREKAGFKDDDSIRAWVKQVCGKGLSEMSADEVSKVVERVVSFANLLQNHLKYGFENTDAMASYAEQVVGKPLHQLNTEELTVVEDGCKLMMGEGN